MQDRNFANGKLGANGSWSLDLKAGNVVATVTYGSAALQGSASFIANSKAGLDELKVLIPGQIDDAIIAVIEQVLAA